MAAKPRLKSGSALPRPSLLSEDMVNGTAPLTAADRVGLDTARRYSPVMVDELLRSATSGEPVDVHELYNAMIRSWPRLAKNIRKIRKAAEMAPWSITPWADPDGNVPDEAKERARTVERAWKAMRPQRGTLEMEGDGICGHFAEGELRGTAVAEILWQTTDDGAGLINCPRAIRPTHPYYYAWPHSGMNYDDAAAAGDRLMYRPAGQRGGHNVSEWPDHQFLVLVAPSWSDHPALAGLLGTIAPWWIAANYGPQWLMNYAQLFGVPIRIGKYPAGDASARNVLSGMLRNIGSAFWAAIPDNASIEIIEASKSAGDLPQKMLIDLADKICDITLLGQSLTTDTAGVGSQALGNVHEGVSLDVMRGILNPVAKLLTNQFAPSCLILNHGNDKYAPTFEHGLCEPEDEKAKAERDSILITAGVEMPKAWFYERHSIPMPAEDEETIGEEKPETPDPAEPSDGSDGSDGSDPADPADPEDPATVQAADATALVPGIDLKALTDVFDLTLQEAVSRGWEAATITARKRK